MERNLPTLLSCVLVIFILSCGDNQAEKAPMEPPLHQSIAADTTALNPVGTTAQKKSSSPVPSIDSTVAQKSSKTKKRPSMQAAPTINSNPQGYPTGYISRKEVAMQSEPKESAVKTRFFKQYEGVIILKSLMSDDNGNATPTWYQVESLDKKQGWVKANCVTIN